ncbi:MAG: ZPR1 zinc finger domain-containing protein [Promethearchaeota archaeon]
MSEEAKKTEEDFSLKCPVCADGIIQIHKAIYKAVDGDKLLILRFECQKCDYLKNDIIPIETDMKPGILTLRVENEEDLKSKIFRSSGAELKIPELELEIKPGPSAQFYFTNIEGVLDRFLQAAKIIKRDIKDDKIAIREIDQAINEIQNAMDGKIPFTLKITDPNGGSYIIPKSKSKYSFEEIFPNESSKE